MADSRVFGAFRLLLTAALVSGSTCYFNFTTDPGRYQNYTFNLTNYTNGSSAIFMNTSFDLNTSKNDLNTFLLLSQQVHQINSYISNQTVYGLFYSNDTWLPENVSFGTAKGPWWRVNGTTNDSAGGANSTLDPLYGTNINSSSLPYIYTKNVTNIYSSSGIATISYIATALVTHWVNVNNDARTKNYVLVIPVQQGGSWSANNKQSYLDFLRNVSQTGSPYGTMAGETEGGVNFHAAILKNYTLNYDASLLAPANASHPLQTPVSSYIMQWRYNNLLPPRPIGNNPDIPSVVYEDYKLNRMAYSWPFWFMVAMVVMYMLISNYLEEHLEYDETMKDNWLTFHPFYSLHRCASEVIFTRRIRLGIVGLTLSAMAWFNALMVHLYIQRWWTEDVSMAIRLALFPFCAAVFSVPFTLMMGAFANLYYRTHRRYVNNLKSLENHAERELELERYEEDSFVWLHIFYFVLIIFGLFFLVFPIWFLYWHTLENQGYWLLQVVISFGWRYLIFDVILMFFGRIGAFYNCMKIWGFWFDYGLHEEFKVVYKIN